MELISQDIQEVEKNLKNIVDQAGPMENQLAPMLESLPRPNIRHAMETD